MNNENYEKVFQDCLRDIKEIEHEMHKNELEIEEKRQTIIALGTRKEDMIQLRDSLRKIMNPLITETESQNDAFSIEAKTDEMIDSKSNFTIKTPDSLVEIPQDAFKEFKNIKEATVLLLRIVRSPLKHPQIADTLLKGGYETKSVVAFSETVRSTLRSVSKSLKSPILRRDRSWHLKEWYENENL